MLHYLSPALMDYNHVNITELVYPREQDQVTFNITIVDGGGDDEIIEQFYLNVIPVENAVVLTPRITVEIGCSKIAYCQSQPCIHTSFFSITVICDNYFLCMLFIIRLVALHCLHLPIRFASASL